MRTGKISENILKRSVLKSIKYKNNGYIKIGASLGCDAPVSIDGTVMAMATAGLMFKSAFGKEAKEADVNLAERLFKLDVKRALCSGINNVAAACGIPMAVMVNLVLPRRYQEQDIKNLMRYISELCVKYELEISGGDTEVTGNVVAPVVTFVVYGNRIDAHDDRIYMPTEGDDIVMSGDIAVSGTALVSVLKESELGKRFAPGYLELARKAEERMCIRDVALAAGNMGITIMHDLSRGGIYSALWEISERTGCGTAAWLDKISVRQETIEVCELYELNPYRLISNGALLMISPKGEELAEQLIDKGFHAAVIGKLTADNDKVLLKNEEKRYIEPPKGDEIYHVLQ